MREESAVPLALPGQVILGGAEYLASEMDAWIGRIVAVSLDDGSCMLKRIGASLPGIHRHLRQFETIGGLGSSIVIATETLGGGNDVPTMVSARRVLGVLYES